MRINAQRELMKLRDELKNQQAIEQMRHQEFQRHFNSGFSYNPNQNPILSSPYTTIDANNYSPTKQGRQDPGYVFDFNRKPRTYSKYHTLEEENYAKQNIELDHQSNHMPIREANAYKVFAGGSQQFNDLLDRYGIRDKAEIRDYAKEQFDLLFGNHKNVDPGKLYRNGNKTTEEEEEYERLEDFLNRDKQGEHHDPEEDNIKNLDNLLNKYKTRGLDTKPNHTHEDGTPIKLIDERAIEEELGKVNPDSQLEISEVQDNNEDAKNISNNEGNTNQNLGSSQNQNMMAKEEGNKINP